MRFASTDTKAFEIEVRNIARQIWPTEGYNGAITVEEQERDSIFVTSELVHYIEITTSKSEKNTIDNLRKIYKLLPTLRAKYPGRLAKGWLITLHEPTGEQGRHIAEYDGRVFHQTYHQFLAKLIDSREYLNFREQAAFGSARNVADNSLEFSMNEYIPAELRDYTSGVSVPYHKFYDNFRRGQVRSLITGEYGVGKSMFLRQIFLDLAKSHRDGRDFAFPVYINLRDHIDAQHPYLCLQKHATSIGFGRPEQLVRAWRAGYVYLLLDGFDELTPTLSTKDIKRAKEIRRSALELVRRFVDETPKNSPLLITGRSNFFDTNQDLVDCLGFSGRWDNFILPDFNQTQVTMYLERKGYSSKLPDWLPKRPLLIGYLISKRFLPDVQQEADSDGMEQDPIVGWGGLLRMVAEREVNQVYIALHPEELLSIYGRIATKCRKKQNLRGPVSIVECQEAFVEVTGVLPEGRSLTALLRLPGLVGADVQDQTGDMSLITHPGSRWFVDDTFVNAVASEDLFRLLSDYHSFDIGIFRGTQHALSDLGVAMALHKLPNDRKVAGALSSTVKAISDRDCENPVAVDVLNAIRASGSDCDVDAVTIRGNEIKEFIVDADAVNLGRVRFEDCYFSKLAITGSAIECAPLFRGCLIELLETHHPNGVVEEKLLSNCEVGSYIAKYDGYEDFRRSSEDDRMIAITSVLDKLFVQSSSGRKTTTLKRGLTQDQNVFIDQITESLRKAGIISKIRRGGESIWMPDRTYLGVVREILRDPYESEVDFMRTLREIGL